MKITFIGFTNIRGGAAKAAVRFQKLLENSGHKALFYSIENNEKKLPFFSKITHRFFWVLSHLLQYNLKSKHSLNIFGSRYIKNKVINAELLHVHWINNETLSIRDFKYLSGKSVITLHDEWFYSATEHYNNTEACYKQVVEGYNKQSILQGRECLSRFIWKHKKKHYQGLNNVIFTVPSSWLKGRAQQSALLRDRDIRVLPNPIDINVFKHDTSNFNIDDLKHDDFVITFGAVDGSANLVKGFDLLLSALELFAASVDLKRKIKIVTFGGKDQHKSSVFGIQSIELGHIYSEAALASIYSLSSIVIVPSRLESFGQVAAESLSCETPVLAFNCTGLTDVIIHKKNGYLANPFEIESLAEGINWFYQLTNAQLAGLGKAGRAHVTDRFSNEVISKQLVAIYKELSSENNIA
ncbi:MULTISPECIES: glycosyltransferase [unclassified Pseudoalteromonas]|uniref:glycosyltransferase n=1 Tax=unclassified Pseudoalteromonas TaxID=194690 RepID=UPI001109CBEE|nr:MULTISPECIES: glycosyltransferase [unclassified Pseudoalteromonas]TMN78121.1 hypothetical protein CWB64_17060 [Pseudoalteromonas sp. S410]TMN90449.1 hypothetical protein CWB62_09465 [Pseudoalteromonas sp. S408]TMN96471.1 hypothetical protein CWB61_12265 [Pseudoalteromonas sp. S407]TMO00602.1 hypothetical protein CWB63_06505 [Pseudoalteromonas sp. S409]TMO07570.1 hypothetical protein CWB57_15625 [Pseudoalteromonas sp. S186]